MSRKIDTFRNALGNPIAIHNFELMIPDFEGFDSPLVVQSTALPNEQLQEIILYYLGERVKWPTIATNSGHWNVTIPENEVGMAFKSMMQAKGFWWDGISGYMLPHDAPNIEVIMRTVNDEPVFKVIMHNTFCIGQADVSLQSNSPTTPFMSNITFSYDWIENQSLR